MARLSFSRAVSRLAEREPGRVVVTAEDGVLTAAALDARATALARAYVGLGVRPDDLVTVALPSSAEALAVCCAVWRAGATPQPLDPTTSPQQLADVVALARPTLVVGRDPGHGAGRAVGGAGSGGSSLPPWVPPGWSPTDADVREVPTTLPDRWATSWKAPTSSGSTGRPSVVVSTAPALVEPEVPSAPFLPLRATQLVVAPITGSAAFTYAVRGLLTGHHLVLLPTGPSVGGGRPDPRVVLDALVRHHVSWTWVSPAVLGDLVRLPAAERAAADLSALERLVHLGARCDPEVKRAAIAWLGPERVVEVYAGSESTGLFVADGQEWLARPGSVGRGVGGTEVRVTRADGSPAAAGEVGEVWMRRPGGPAYRYLGRESRRDGDGWDTLGDLGHLDADGHLFLLDRAGDVHVRDGVPVAPADVEHVLERHPGVRGAAVRWEEGEGPPRLVAVVELTDGAPSDVSTWCTQHLPAPARPDVVEVATAPVRSTTGKVRRHS
ncbi:AMP-binding protein [Pseudokineococcus sp. 1T1Z-3]|uniref:AMP-binding protein n=1 Tax=Pseudokineococcus sp. 1T1Z-3 TaxID=3132745 RepID=UPI00309DCE07